MKDYDDKKMGGEKVLKGGDIGEAARFAEGARMMRGTMGAMPPKGPAKEPAKLNGVPMMPDRGVSKN